MASPTKSRFAPEPVPAYSGLVDDFSLRFEDYCVVDIGSLNRRLINAVLIGDPLLINDGYVVMNPALRSAITVTDQSPFCDLVESGFVRILTRNGAGLERLAEDMADLAIGNAHQLVTSDFYRATYQPALGSLMNKLVKNEEKQSFLPWPADLDVSAIFAKTSAATYQAMAERGVFPADDLDRFYDEFQAGKKQRRTEWEKVGDKLREDGKLSKDLHLRLMQVASEAYQYAWGCALSEPGRPIRVQTQAPRYLDFDAEVPVDHLDGMAEDRRVTIEIPLFDSACKKVGSNWKQLVAASRNDEFLHQKQDFRDALDVYHNGTTGEGREELDEAAAVYTKFLKKYFKNRRRFDLTYGLFAATVGAGVGLAAGPVGAAAGAGIGFGVGAVTEIANYLGLPDLIMKVAPVGGKHWIDLRPEMIKSPLTSSFLIDPVRAAPFRDVPPPMG